MTSARARARRERDVRAVAHDDVAHAHPGEHVEDEIVAVRRRVALGRDLRVVEAPVPERDERDALGEHERDE